MGNWRSYYLLPTTHYQPLFKMSDEVMVNYQIPQDWQAKIKRLAAERKKEPRQIIDEALAQYLGEAINTSDIRLNALETEVSMLRGQLSQLEITVRNLQQQLLAAVSTIDRSDTVVRRSQVFQEVQMDDDDDFGDDEPDEILYDFLPPEERQSR